MYVMIDILSHLEDILKHQVHWGLLGQYYLLNLPIMFVQVAPFGCLLATLYAFGKLNHDNEIIAMRASGLSVMQITKTAVVLGCVVSVLIFWINDRFVPQALTRTEKIKIQMEEGKKNKENKQEVIDNLSMYGHHNRLFFISKFNLTTQTMYGIVILQHDENQNPIMKIIANRAEFDGNVWHSFETISYKLDVEGQVIGQPAYTEKGILDITETPADFLVQLRRPDSMSISQLKDYLKKLRKSGASSVVRNLKIDFYQRFTSPFTSLVIVLLGIPFSLRMRKRATGLSSIGLSIMVGFLYYIVDAISIAIGKGGALPPFLAASLSHFLGLIYSTYLIRRLP